jgi:hypothetical protein
MIAPTAADRARYVAAFRELIEASIPFGGDASSYARSKEILLACLLGHNVATDYSGADALLPDGTPVEYKSTIGKVISATYNGISVKDTWEEQERYLVEEKLGKYPQHFYARFNGSKVEEVWCLSSDAVLAHLLPKIQEKFKRGPVTKKGTRKADGRYLDSSIPTGYIRQHGTRVL